MFLLNCFMNHGFITKFSSCLKLFQKGMFPWFYCYVFMRNSWNVILSSAQFSTSFVWSNHESLYLDFETKHSNSAYNLSEFILKIGKINLNFEKCRLKGKRRGQGLDRKATQWPPGSNYINQKDHYCTCFILYNCLK